MNKTTKIFFIKTENSCKIYIVADKLSFYKMRLVTYSIFQLQYHGSIPWVNEYHGQIPWVNEYHGWVNTMGGSRLQYHG